MGEPYEPNSRIAEERLPLKEPGEAPLSSAGYFLTQIPQGWFMSWSMSTQTASNVCVTLFDSAATYVNGVCRQNQTFGILSQGFEQVQGQGLQIQISTNGTDPLQVQASSYNVNDPTGKLVGIGYNLLVEDFIDHDFNDLFVSIIAWQSNG